MGSLRPDTANSLTMYAFHRVIVLLAVSPRWGYGSKLGYDLCGPLIKLAGTKAE